MGKVIAVCISEKKGVQKHEVKEAEFKVGAGMVNDAHSGNWHRQISLLGLEKIEDFRAKGAEVDFGDFGENLVVSGYALKENPVGTRYRCGGVELTQTQIGKECHNDCVIARKMGYCIMPKECVFCVVTKDGVIKPGDEFEIIK